MKRKIGLFLFVVCSSMFGQAVDISGYTIVQANATNTITLPIGTKIQPGGFVIVGRNATQSAFETFWGITLGSNVKYINGFDVVGSNGFPTINGAETFVLNNASNNVVDGPTIALTAGKAYERISISGAANSASSWSEVAQTSATPGSGVTNTNSGKIVISEFSDASSFSDEFVELYYDVTPAPAGHGSVGVSPSQWKFNQGVDLRFVLKTDSVTLKGFSFVLPQSFIWSAGNISSQPSGSITTSGDTIQVGGVSINTGDSLVVIISSLQSSDTTDMFTFDCKATTDSMNYSNIQFQPGVLVIGSPQPISAVKMKDGTGAYPLLGKWVVIQGVVTVANEFAGGTASGGPAYIQDATGGATLYDTAVVNNVQRGDNVIVLGMVAPFNDLFELAPCSVLEVVSQGNTFDTTVVTIAQLTSQPMTGVEQYEGRLVRINNITSVTSTTSGSPVPTWAVTGSGTNYNITDATGTMQTRISPRINLVNLPTPGGSFDMVCVVGQFTTSYQVLPRSYDDIVEENQGPRIVSQPPFESNINPTSLTISWATDLFGTSVVKYGKTPALGSTVTDTNKVTNHHLDLTNLSPATMYYVQLQTANGTGTTTGPVFVVSTSSLTSTGEIDVFFNKTVNTSVAQGEDAQTVVNLSQKTIDRINAATYSIDMAAYSFSGSVGTAMATALVAAKGRGVKIRVIGEADNSSSAAWTSLSTNGIPVIFDSFDAVNAGAGLMHNKFYVFDNRDTVSDTDDWVISGSWNATDPGTNNDAQNLVEIQDKSLANAYTAEFNEMWGSNTDTPNAANSRFGARKLDNTPHSFVVNGTPIEVYFSPSDHVTNHIINTINKATYSINFALYSFTRSDIGDAFIAKKDAGINVHGVVDNSGPNELYTPLKSAGVDIYLKGFSGGLLHHKYAIIDAETKSSDQYTITGSHNWSSNAENSNNENTLIFHSKRISNLFLQEFKARYIEAGGTADIAVGVHRTEDQVPARFGLQQNYPNPFNPSTTIRFSIPATAPVSLSVFDILGREVATLVDRHLTAGNYSVEWNATGLSSGIYFYRLQAGNDVQTRKLLLEK